MPFGSERSHFAHSPHLLASLILLIPPEIGGELKRKARSRSCGPGFCCARIPGDLMEPGRTGALALPALPSGRVVVGKLQGQNEGDSAGFAGLGRAGSAGGKGWTRRTRPVPGGIPRCPGVPRPRVRGPPPTHAPPRRSVALQLISLHAIYHL